MSRQNLGVLIVTAAVVLGLITALFIIPMIQPRSLDARAELDEAAERAARRLNVLERMADQAVAADQDKLMLPANILKPDAEAIQRAIATKQNLISDSAGKVSAEFKALLADHDKRYEAVTGRKPSDGDRAETIQVPAGESAQVGWVKQTLAKGEDPTARLSKDLNNAASELQTSISSISLDTYRGSDHFRANWLLGSLQYQQAMLLTNLAANRRAKASMIRAQLQDEYGWYTSAAAQVKGIESRLAAITPSEPIAAAPVAKVTPTPNPIAAAMEAAGPAPVTPDTSAAPAPAPAAEGQPETGGLLSRVGSLLKSAAAAAPATGAPAQPTGESAVVKQAPTAMPATEDPSVLAARYEQEINEQIAEAEKKVADLQQVMAEPQQQLQQVNQQIEQLQQKLAQLEQAGYDVTSVASFEIYKKSYNDLTAQSRAAEATAQALQEGTMVGAQLDPDSGDDLTKAKYTGGQPQVGLTTLAKRLEGQQKTVELLKAARQEMQDLRASLQQQKLGQEKALEEARARTKELAGQLAKTYGEMDAELADAAKNEAAALALCKTAIQSYNTALQAAKRQQQDAAEQLRTANPAPDKPNDRLDWLSKYDSPQAASEYGLFNAYMLTAQIEMQQALSLQGSQHLVQLIQAVGVETKVADMDKAVQESLDAAIGALGATEGGSGALQHADAYGRLVSKEKFAWLGPASRGLVYNALALAQVAKGQPQQATEAKTKAIEALGEATKGAENSEMLQPYTHLLASLRKDAQ